MALTVQELIEELQGLDPAMEVHFSYNYGDHWRTEVAPAVHRVEVGIVEYSDYHRMDKVVEQDYDDEDTDQAAEPKGKEVVLIG